MDVRLRSEPWLRCSAAVGLPTRSNEIQITSLEKKNLKDKRDFFILMAY